jgi:Uma2 family endonuclease
MATAATTQNVPSTPTDEPEGLFEVIGSQIVETPPMGTFETELASLLQNLMGPFAQSNRLGRVVTEMLFSLRPAVDRERRPDVAFVADERWPIGRRAPRGRAWAVVPDLAIEIISPGNEATAVMGKIEEYFQAGVRLVWVVYPGQRKIYVYQSPTSIRVLAEGDELDGGTVLPGFRVGLRELFGDDDQTH